jgi:hypothetical protein
VNKIAKMAKLLKRGNIVRICISSVALTIRRMLQYLALLDSSYFWASKGGRGGLLEKIIALLGNSYSANGATLPKDCFSVNLVFLCQ